MSEIFRQGWLYWKLIIFKTSNGFFLAVAAVFLAATDGVDLDTFSFWQKFRLCIFCAVAGGKFLEGFFDQTITRLQKGKPLIPETGDDDTDPKRFVKAQAVATVALPDAPKP